MHLSFTSYWFIKETSWKHFDVVFDIFNERLPGISATLGEPKIKWAPRTFTRVNTVIWESVIFGFFRKLAISKVVSVSRMSQISNVISDTSVKITSTIILKFYKFYILQSKFLKILTEIQTDWADDFLFWLKATHFDKNIYFNWHKTFTLTHLLPMHPFSTPWKRKETLRFSDVFRG